MPTTKVDVQPRTGEEDDAEVKNSHIRYPVYVFGKNNYSQLGLYHVDPSVGHIDQHCAPQILSFFGSKRIVRVACGYEHSLVVTEDQEVFGFGRNDNAQLGIGETGNGHNTPVRVAALCGKGIKLLTCGAHFTICTTESGDVFGHGANRHGQLGLGHCKEQVVPVEIPLLCGKGATVISCGGYHSLVATKRGDLFAFGKNERGQLGLGDLAQRVTPEKVLELCGREITNIAAGFRHSIVATGDKDVYGFGNNRFVTNSNSRAATLSQTADRLIPRQVW